MLTYKKMALVAAAGFAAFAISCSDEAEDEGGTLTGFDVVDSGKDGDITIKGNIKANDSVVSVVVTAGGKTLEWNEAIAYGKDVTLNDKIKGKNANVCDTKTGTAENIEFKITVKFSSGSDVSDSKTIPVNCSGNVTTGEVYWASFILSSAGESYADLDVKATYKQTEIEGKEDLIDLVAYQNGITTPNNIYAPCSDTDGNKVGGKCGYTRLFDTEEAMDDAADEDEGKMEIAITNGKVFYVEAGNGDVSVFYKVTITAVGTATVTLKAEKI